jgi:glucosylceramidase
MRLTRPHLPFILASAAAAALVVAVLPATFAHGAPAPDGTAARDTAAVTSGQVQAWETTSDLSQALSPQPSLQFTTGTPAVGQTIAVDPDRTFQKITGFGATFTDSAAYEMWDELAPSQRATVMSNLFDPNNPNGIHLSMLRQPAGSTDFVKSVNGFYTYDDLPPGQTDPSLSHFSIAHDEAYIIPVLRDALENNPALKVILTSWSPPAWMKTNDSIINGGTLEPQFYRTYADYLDKAIQAYQHNGIPIWATSAQNEPTVDQTYPSMLMSSTQEATFVQKYYRPALTAAGLNPTIFAGDDVCFSAAYSSAVLDHPGADAAFGAVSMHGYCGSYQDLTIMHELQPNVGIYQTELSPGCQSQNPAQLITGAMSNWARSAITWNVALDPNGGPMYRGDSSTCVPLVTVGTNGMPTYTLAYYQEGQASRFVQPGAVAIAATGSGPVQDVAFRNPDGQKVLMAYNPDSTSQEFTVQWGNSSFTYTLPAGATVTFTWSGTEQDQTYGWGDSTFGTDNTTPYAGGLQTGSWDLLSSSAADATSLDSGWDSTYLGYADLQNYTVRVDVQPVTLGTAVGAPKYGIYACYHDPNNYVQGWFDTINHFFVTNTIVDGMDVGFNNTSLPANFDFSAVHQIEAQRNGESITFLVDGKVVANTVAPSTDCQIGLVTQDYTAQFSNVSVTRG